MCISPEPLIFTACLASFGGLIFGFVYCVVCLFNLYHHYEFDSGLYFYFVCQDLYEIKLKEHKI